MSNIISWRVIVLTLISLGAGIVTVVLGAAKADPVRIQLRTEGLSTPLALSGDPSQRSVTAFELQGELLADGTGRGTLTLDESTYQFNKFGDSTKGTPKAAPPFAVIFKRLAQVPLESKRQSYEIAFANGLFPNMFFFVLEDAVDHHHLIVKNAKWVGSAIENTMHILQLNGSPEITPVLPDAPQRNPVYFRALSTYLKSHLIGPHWVVIGGKLNGDGKMQLDLNQLGLNNFGDVGVSTLMYCIPQDVTFKRLDVRDPLNKNRSLFQLNLSRKTEANYVLVVGQTEAGTHRLLTYEGDLLKNVATLFDPDRETQKRLQIQLRNASAKEQDSIALLRKAIGYQFSAQVIGNAVTGLRVFGGHEAIKIDPALSGLSNLKQLELSGCPLTDKGMPSLKSLMKLELLRIGYTTVSDAGLESLSGLHGLQNLSIQECSGVTDKGLVHLSALTNLRFLRLDPKPIQKPGQPQEPRITDAGLAYLKDLKNLENLMLIGQDITDAGLENLSGLKNLRQLEVSGTGVTVEGKAKLAAKLPLLDRRDNRK